MVIKKGNRKVLDNITNEGGNMTKIKDFFFNYKYYLCGLIIALLLIGYFLFSYDAKPVLANVINEEEKEETQEIIDSFYVDIKGAVINPGVYKVEKGSIVNDLIVLAGGLSKSATTSNINLSKELHSEMVIKVFTKNELSKAIKCECDTTSVIEQPNVVIKPEEVNDECAVDNTNKVNINTASVSELSTLNGVGESKAQTIIDYRNTNGLFQTIEDIMNVPGFKEAAFAKIKESITV